METDIRMVRARSQLIQRHAFFGALCMRLLVVERNDIPTCATDGKHLFYSRTFLDKISPVELLFVVAHEVLHCALSHMTRRGNRRWDLYQAATDYVVNWLLHIAGFEVPKWVKYFDQRFADLSVESVYRILEDEEQKQKQQQLGKPDQCASQSTSAEDEQQSSTSPDETSSKEDPGSGEDISKEVGNTSASSDGLQENKSSQDENQSDYAKSYGDPGGCGEVLDAAPPHDQAALSEIADEWQVYTRQAASIAKRVGEGKLPGFIEEIIDVLDNPKTDWRSALWRFMGRSDTKDHTWTRVNRRMFSLGYYTPGTIDSGINHAAMAIDSSGSVDTEALSRVGTEIQAALNDGVIDKITLLFVDTKVHRTEEYTKGQVIDFTVQGRGGTAFSPAFDWVNDNLSDVSLMIYFTDLECSDFGEQPTYPVLWAVHGDNPGMVKAYMEQVPFGDCIELHH